MNDGPGRLEFQSFCDRIERTIREGFEGTHERLDAINGRVRAGEIADGVLSQRVTGLEKEVFPRRRRGDPVEADHADERVRERRETKRDAALLAVGFATLYAGMKLLTILGEFLIGLAKNVVKVP